MDGGEVSCVSVFFFWVFSNLAPVWSECWMGQGGGVTSSVSMMHPPGLCRYLACFVYLSSPPRGCVTLTKTLREPALFRTSQWRPRDPGRCKSVIVFGGRIHSRSGNAACGLRARRHSCPLLRSFAGRRSRPGLSAPPMVGCQCAARPGGGPRIVPCDTSRSTFFRTGLRKQLASSPLREDAGARSDR